MKTTAVWISVFTTACACLMKASPAVAAEQAPRPNIVFIFSDDHASQAIGAYGNKLAHTPRLDKLASEGMRFQHCLCTNSICGPSRAVVLTGKYSHLNGFRDNKAKFDGSQQTFPKLLQKAGYQTAIVGKWHLVTDPTGFDYWEVVPGQGLYYNPNFKTPAGVAKTAGYVTDIITDKAIDWLKNQRDKSKPFLLMCHHKAPHRSWEPPAKYLNLFDKVTFPEPDSLFDDYSGRASPAKNQEMTIDRHMRLSTDLKVMPQAGDADEDDAKAWKQQINHLNAEQRKAWDAYYEPRNAAFRKANLGGKDLVRWKYQEYMKDYLRCIASVDENVGRLVDYLDEAGLAANTVVIYSSDQGFYLGEHGWYDKRWMYEESLQMPLIVRWPGKTKPGSVNETMVSNLDFAETFLDMAGVAIPDDMQGRSITGVLQGKTPTDWRKSFYYHYYEFPQPHRVPPHYGVRTTQHKLVYYPMTDEWELFDMAKDPKEMKSVYADPAYADTVKELKAELKRLREQYKDTEDK